MQIASRTWQVKKSIKTTLLELMLLFREHEKILNKYRFSAERVVIERDTHGEFSVMAIVTGKSFRRRYYLT